MTPRHCEAMERVFYLAVVLAEVIRWNDFASPQTLGYSLETETGEFEEWHDVDDAVQKLMGSLGLTREALCIRPGARAMYSWMDASGVTHERMVPASLCVDDHKRELDEYVLADGLERYWALYVEKDDQYRDLKEAGWVQRHCILVSYSGNLLEPARIFMHMVDCAMRAAEQRSRPVLHHVQSIVWGNRDAGGSQNFVTGKLGTPRDKRYAVPDLIWLSPADMVEAAGGLRRIKPLPLKGRHAEARLVKQAARLRKAGFVQDAARVDRLRSRKKVYKMQAAYRAAGGSRRLVSMLNDMIEQMAGS